MDKDRLDWTKPMTVVDVMIGAMVLTKDRLRRLVEKDRITLMVVVVDGWMDG